MPFTSGSEQCVSQYAAVGVPLLLLRDVRDVAAATPLLTGRGLTRMEPVPLHPEVAEALREHGVVCQPLDWSLIATPRQIRDQALELIRDLRSAEVAGQPLFRWLAVDGVSLWQFAPSYLFPHLEAAIASIDLLVRLVEELKPRQVVAVLPRTDRNGIWVRSLQAVARYYGVALWWWDGTAQRADDVGVPCLGAERRRMGFLAANVLRFLRSQDVRECIAGIWGYIVSRVALRPRAGEGQRTIVLLSHARNWVRSYDPSDRRFHWNDEQCYPPLAALVSEDGAPEVNPKGQNPERSAEPPREESKPRWRVVGIDCFYGVGRRASPPWRFFGIEGRINWGLWQTAWSLVHRVFWERRVQWRSLYAYCDRQTLRVLRGSRRIWRQRFPTLYRDPGFGRMFVHRGISLKEVLGPELEEVFTRRLPVCCGYLRMAAMMLETERPSVCLLSYETGPLARAVVIEAARTGIPTVGLAHGVVYPGSSDYSHERGVVTTDDPLGVMVPTVTCVYGEAARRILVRSGGYPEETVVVTGNWRWDRYLSGWGQDEKADLTRRFRLPAGRQVVLMATTNIPTTETQLRAVARAIRSLENVICIVKPHPAEYPALHARVLREERVSQGRVIQGYLAELLMLAEVVISEFSTVGLDAAFLGKPVVWTRFFQGPSFLPDGVSLGETVDEPARLADAIRRVLDRPAGEAAACDAIVRDYCFEPDGRAARRVVAVIHRLIRTANGVTR